MVFSDIADRMVWPPSLWRDRKWPYPQIRRKITLWMLVTLVTYRVGQKTDQFLLAYATQRLVSLFPCNTPILCILQFPQ